MNRKESKNRRTKKKRIKEGSNERKNEGGEGGRKGERFLFTYG